MKKNDASTFESEYPYIGRVLSGKVDYRFPFRTIEAAVEQSSIYAALEATHTDKGVLWGVWDRAEEFQKLENAVKYGVVSGKKKREMNKKSTAIPTTIRTGKDLLAEIIKEKELARIRESILRDRSAADKEESEYLDKVQKELNELEKRRIYENQRNSENEKQT